MNNGGMFLLTVIVFFFCLWLIGGGQYKSIYTQGIFITPITHEGEQQHAYGPTITINKTVTAPGGGSATIGTNAGSAPSNSSLIGKLTLTRTTQPAPSNPNQAFLEFTLASSYASPVNVNGWKFVSASTGGSAVLATTDTYIQPAQSILIVTSFPATMSHDTMELVDSSGNLVASVTY